MIKEKKEKDYTGFPGDCSEKQLKVLEAFKQKVYTEFNLSSPPYDEPYLLRFCRARKFDLTKILKMFEEFLQWRKEKDVDNIDSFQFDELEEVRKNYPHGYHMTCKQGRPIYIERLGQLKIDEVFKCTTSDRLIQYYIQSYELLVHQIFPECTLAHGSYINQSFTILDLQGAGIGMATKKVYGFVQLASKMCQDSYPEILGKMFIVNAPFVFTGVWSVIKPWLDARTKDKIKILGSNYQKEILQHVDINNLPDFLGGNSPHKLEDNIGPWNPNGENKFFGKDKNVFLNRNIVNDVEWMKNYKLNGDNFKQDSKQPSMLQYHQHDDDQNDKIDEILV